MNYSKGQKHIRRNLWLCTSTKMDVSRALILSYQKNTTFFDTKNGVRLSKALSCTPHEIIAKMELNRAKRLNN